MIGFLCLLRALGLCLLLLSADLGVLRVWMVCACCLGCCCGLFGWLIVFVLIWLFDVVYVFGVGSCFGVCWVVVIWRGLMVLFWVVMVYSV